MPKVLLINGSAEGGILFNCFVAQSVAAKTDCVARMLSSDKMLEPKKRV
jgi:hypothetical protein